MFDREGYSPELFQAMRRKRIAMHIVRLAAGDLVTTTFQSPLTTPAFKLGSD